ncbi:MAG: succinate dehydrogenase cytochrome b subunit [Chthoniobacterales bacterium]
MSIAPASSKSSIGGSLPLLRWLASSIGKKIIVALTGILLVGYVVLHLIGNLSIFLGQNAINTYALGLHSLGPLLWIARIILLIAFVAHIYTTIRLTIENRASRPQKYAVKTNVQTNIFARTMAISGIIVLAFVIFHLAQFTLEMVHPEYRGIHDSLGRHDVYSMVILGFQNFWVSLFYIIAIGLLTFHLSHGIGSLFQTLGITNRKLQPIFTQGGRILALLIFLGYASIPIAVFTKSIKLPREVLHQISRS